MFVLLKKAYLPLPSVFIDQLTQSCLKSEQLRKKGLEIKLQEWIFPFDGSETFLSDKLRQSHTYPISKVGFDSLENDMLHKGRGNLAAQLSVLLSSRTVGRSENLRGQV